MEKLGLPTDKKYTFFTIGSKDPAKKEKGETLFDNTFEGAYYSEQANKQIIIAKEKFAIFDGTPQNNPARLGNYELMFQASKERGIVPTHVAQEDIANADTRIFIESALKEVPNVDSAARYIKLTPDPKNPTNAKWFDTLLGSDNGRPTQVMTNRHPDYFNKKIVTEIHAFGKLGDGDQTRNAPIMISIIG